MKIKNNLEVITFYWSGKERPFHKTEQRWPVLWDARVGKYLQIQRSGIDSRHPHGAQQVTVIPFPGDCAAKTRIYKQNP